MLVHRVSSHRPAPSGPDAHDSPAIERAAQAAIHAIRRCGIPACASAACGLDSHREQGGRAQPALGRRDREGGRELPGLRRADPGPGRALARPDQGRGSARERRARAARPGHRRADRRRRRSRRSRRVRRPVPDRRLPDRLGHELQHERERGDRGARGRRRPRERPREHGPVVERRLPVRGPPRRARRDRPRPPARARAPRRLARAQGVRVRRRRQVRADAPDGRGARSRSARSSPATRRRSARGSRASRTRCRASARSRSAGPPRAPASTRIPSSPRACGAPLRDTGLTVSAPVDHFEAQAARDGLVEASGALKVVAVSLTKIANDLRLMGSGPRAGLAEIFLPSSRRGARSCRAR